MTIRFSTKEKVMVGVALAVVAANLLMATGFVLYLRRGMALLARREVVLPVAAGAKIQPDEAAGESITLMLRADGTLLADGREMAVEAVLAMLDANAPVKVKLRASSRVHYDRLKVFLKTLSEHHVENVTFSVVEEG